MPPPNQPPNQPMPPAPPAGPVSFPLPATPPPPGQKNDAQPTTISATPTVVDDGDAIEKDWVQRARQIVERNRNDPYKQSEELTAFRADYLKKHFNKDIRLDT
jgi:hypothetical protein